MLTYEYIRPDSIGQACETLAHHMGEAAVIAGGTDLLAQIRGEDKKLASLRYLVDLTHIPGMKSITKEGDIISIGAMASHTDIAGSPVLQKEAQFLCEACASVGSPQIRNMGTIGGNIANASPAADPVTPLIALGAEVVTARSGVGRAIPLASLYKDPYVTILESDEIITQIRFKALPAGAGTAFVKLGRRKALAISRMNVAVALVFDIDRKVADSRICAGSVFPKPMRAAEAEALVKGHITEEVAEAAGVKVAEAMIGITGVRWSTEYKGPVIRSLVKRAVLLAAKVRTP